VIKPLIKGLKLAPFVECPDCRVLTEYSKEKCLRCSATLSLSQDQIVHFVVLNMGAKYTPFVECPNCLKLVRVGIRRCADCYEEIPETYALASAITVVTNTVACDVAASLRTFDAFAVPAMILSVLFCLFAWYYSDPPGFAFFILIWPIQPLILILLWFYRFGRLGLGDKEYLQTRQRMKGSLMLWLTILAVQSLAIAVLYL
jgi:hypothetical protein